MKLEIVTQKKKIVLTTEKGVNMSKSSYLQKKNKHVLYHELICGRLNLRTKKGERCSIAKTKSGLRMTILPQTQKSSNTKNQLLRKDNSNNGNLFLA